MAKYTNCNQTGQSGDTSRTENQRKNSAGFSLVGLLTLLPLLLSIALGAASFAYELREHTRYESSCVHIFYSTFDLISQLANSLLQLNPKAQKLRHQHHIAQLRLQGAIATGNAVRILACERRLATIEFAQAALGQQQQALLQQIKNLQERLPLKLRAFFRDNNLTFEIPDFAIYADRQDDLAPVYVVPKEIRHLQKSWVRYELKHKNQNCGASLELRNSILRATLIEVNSET